MQVTDIMHASVEKVSFFVWYNCSFSNLYGGGGRAVKNLNAELYFAKKKTIIHNKIILCLFQTCVCTRDRCTNRVRNGKMAVTICVSVLTQ